MSTYTILIFLNSLGRRSGYVTPHAILAKEWCFAEGISVPEIPCLPKISLPKELKCHKFLPQEQL